jgi:hypothetical protein
MVENHDCTDVTVTQKYQSIFAEFLGFKLTYSNDFAHRVTNDHQVRSNAHRQVPECNGPAISA